MREGLDEVLAPDLCWIHAELAGDQVDNSLDQVRRLGAAGPAIGVGGHAVGEDADAPRVDGFEVVAAATEEARDHLERAEDAVVRANVEELRELQTEQRTVSLRRDLNVKNLPASVRGRLQALGAILDPFHRSLGDLRRRCGEILLRVRPELRTEAAADIVADDPELQLGNTDRTSDEEPDEVGHLRRGPERAPVVVGDVVGDATARLHRGRKESLLTDALLENDISLRERCVNVAAGEGCIPADVVRSVALHQRAPRHHGLLDVHHRGERLVVDHNQLCCIVGQIPVFGDHHRNRLAGICRLFGRDRKLLRDLLLVRDKRVGDRQGSEDDALEVGGGEDRDHAFGRQRCRGVDRANAGVCVRAAHHRHVRHVHEVDVVDEVAVPGDQLGVLATLNAGPDHGRDSHG